MAPTLLFLKADIPAGARWITVHPHGKDEKGQPVLIEPQSDGSAKVIGGAGGALNHLRIRAVKSESEYKADAERDRLAKREADKAQRERDKKAGLVEAKKAARERVQQQQVAHEREFVDTVAKLAGWKPEDLAAPAVETLSEKAAKKALAGHHQKLLAAAQREVELNRRSLVADAERRAAAGLGELPLETKDPASLSVADLAPIPPGGGLGFAPQYGKRAEAAGLTPEERQREAAAARASTQTDEQRAAGVKRGEAAKMISDELAGLRERDRAIEPSVVEDAARAADMLRAHKKLQQIASQAQAARKEIKTATAEPKAYVLEYTTTPQDDKRIAEGLENDLRTARTHAFLAEFHRMAGGDPEETLGAHMAGGAFNSVNALALAVGGKALVDRSVVDVLGIAGAAQVLARRIHTDMPADAERVAVGMQQFHLHHYMQASQAAMDKAGALMEAAKKIEIGEAETAVELQAGQEMNAVRRRAVVDAQRILGRAAGEMEANAALVLALQRGKTDADANFSMGRLGLEETITRARALGLRPGDYTVDSAGGTTFLNIKPQGMDRLAKPIDRADVQQLQRNLAIAAGDEDEADWMPAGVARRPDLAMSTPAGAAPRLAKPFTPGADMHAALRDYIGGRAADGDTPADIIADIQSADFFQKAGAGYLGALQEVAPLQGPDGKQRRAEDLAETFDRYADEFVQREYGGERSPLNRQQIQVDDTAAEALHRALAEHPDGVAAYKPIGDLTPQDQRALRETFYREVAKESPEAAELRHELEQHAAAEPQRQVEDLFGETIDNPEWADWRARRDELATKVGQASLDWQRYADTMRGHERAYEAIQDLIRSKVGKTFVDAHNKLRPDAPLKLGRAVIRGNLNHLDATDPAARDRRMASEREMIDALRERNQGRYAAGSVGDKMDAAREEREAFEQAQMGFFSTEDAPVASEGAERALAGDERYTVGHAAERQIAALMDKVGPNFKPGRPLQVGQATMSGGNNTARQRAVKLIQANKRLGLHLGPGSGKTLVAMSALTQAIADGQASRGAFIVPSVVQGQFGGEALKFLEPGKFKWHCDPGASREQRLAAYRDKSNHFCVVTHQAMRDDLLHLGARHAGVSEGQMRDRLSAMTRDERKAWAAETLHREGIHFDFSAVDEGHNLLDRAGKDDSGLSMAIGGLTDHTPMHISMTGDPVRNDDASEVFSALQKIAPDRYTDRGEFMRRYGANTTESRAALKREMARHFYAHAIEPDVRTDRITSTSPLTEKQRQALAGLDRDIAAMRMARMGKKVDIEAAKRVSPGSFAGVPADQHEAVARALHESIGIVRDAATRRAIDEDPEGGKMGDLVSKVQARKGKPGIVFAHSLASVQAIAAKLEQAGHKVVTITGHDSSEEKDRKRREFDAGGDAILVASDAASTGLNGQHGRWVMQYDTPMTAMTHAQREARARRIGQVHDVELIDLVGDHPAERRSRDRLARKYAMRDVMTSPSEMLDDSGLSMFLTQALTERGQVTQN